MPTYAYRCPSCRHAFDLFHKISETAERRCPKCDTVAERVITGGAGLVFKGSGFYITDYKKGTGEQHGDGAKDRGEKRDAGAKDKGGKTDGAATPKTDGGKQSTGDTSTASKKTPGDGT